MTTSPAHTRSVALSLAHSPILDLQERTTVPCRCSRTASWWGCPSPGAQGQRGLRIGICPLPQGHTEVQVRFWTFLPPSHGTHGIHSEREFWKAYLNVLKGPNEWLASGLTPTKDFPRSLLALCALAAWPRCKNKHSNLGCVFASAYTALSPLRALCHRIHTIL